MLAVVFIVKRYRSAREESIAQKKRFAISVNADINYSVEKFLTGGSHAPRRYPGNNAERA
jgi:hypothetical protein